MTITILIGSLIIIFPIIIYCFSTIKYSKLNDDMYIYQNDYLEDKYKWWKIFALLIIISIVSAISIILPNIIVVVSNYAIKNTGEVIYLINPDYWFWMILSAFWGIIVSSLLTNLIMKIILGRNYREFYIFMNSPYGFKVKTGEYLSIIVSIIIGIFGTIYFVFGMNWYVKFTSNEIIENNYFGLSEKRHNYDAVKTITTYDKIQYNNSKIEDDYHIVIEFKDGQRWDSLGYGRSNNMESDKMIADYISQKSAKKIVYNQIDIAK